MFGGNTTEINYQQHYPNNSPPNVHHIKTNAVRPCPFWFVYMGYPLHGLSTLRTYTMKEILLKLLPHYKKHLEVVKELEGRENIIYHLWASTMKYGICMCSKWAFDTPIENEVWVSKKMKGDSCWWCTTPSNCDTKDEIIAALQTRIDIMESLLKEEPCSA